MRKFKIIALLVVLGFTAACDKEIELKPDSILTYNGFWDTEEAARAAHIGLYANFRARLGTFWGMGALRSDLWGGKTFESPNDVNLIDNNISSTIVPYANWAGFYGYMHHINDFLYNIEGVEFKNETEKQHMIGQVYGLRAYMYYTMLKTWGGVPITTEPLLDFDPSQLAKARSSEEEVMNQVKSDIESSLAAFAGNNDFWNGSKEYWSRAATLTLKGDAYIWSGNLLGGGQADFAEAKAALEEVQGMGFSLVEDYDDLWGEENENNEEFIFKVDFTQDQAGNFYGVFTGRSTEINATWDDRGNSMADFVANGGNRYGPSVKLLTVLDDPLDDRRDATFIRLYNNDAGHIPFDEDGYQASILNKFLGVVEAGSRLSNNDVPIYRYADVILLLAEAKTRLGEDPSTEINLIRERAYGADYDPAVHAYTGGTETENMNAILNERLKEFVGEGKRWWDLRRAGNEFVFQEVETLDASEAYKLVLPITQDMMANNDLLEQTPGYD